MPDSHRLHRIEDLPRLAGATVAVRAWVTTTRSSGKISFVMLRDGTGYVQAVVSKKDVPDAVWQACGKLTQETSVEVVGAVRADPRAPRSEEHTSELQSPCNLVCRLLLEKKKLQVPVAFA